MPSLYDFMQEHETESNPALRSPNVTVQDTSELANALKASPEAICLRLLNCPNLEGFAEAVGLMENIRALEMQLAGDIIGVPEEIGQLNNLTELCIRDFVSVPKSIGQLNNLERLSISSVGMESIPAEIGQLGKLKYFNLFAGELDSLPPEIGNLASLQELDITAPKLERIPPEIDRLGRLNRLSVTDTMIVLLPKELSGLRQLKWLNLSDNPYLFEIPSSLSTLRSLVLVELRNLPELKYLPKELRGFACHHLIFDDLPNLKLPASLAALPNLESISIKGDSDYDIPNSLLIWNSREGHKIDFGNLSLLEIMEDDPDDDELDDDDTITASEIRTQPRSRSWVRALLDMLRR